MTYRAVFFDAGETLVHPHPSFPDLFATVLAREGFPVSTTTLHEHLHVLMDRFARAAAENELWTTSPERSRLFWHSVYEVFLDELELPSDNGLPDVLYREFTDLSNYALFDDVLPALARLRSAGLRLGVISNFEEWLERLLEQLGVNAYFDVRVISGVEGMEKPDPALFRLALDRAGVDASESVYVGDNPELDIVPSGKLGMFPVLIDRRGHIPGSASARITSMAELPALLGLAR